MKAIDVNPRLIGHRLRVEADTMSIEGQLQDLGVLTETLVDNNLCSPDRETARLTGVILTIAGHELRLHGNENVAITGGRC